MFNSSTDSLTQIFDDSPAISCSSSQLTNNSTSQNTIVTSAAFNDLNLIQISNLNPFQENWYIKVRVTKKTEKRNWSNEKSNGTVFTCNLIDQSGEIRATAFRDACDSFYDLIQIEHVYLIANAKIKQANKKFNSTNNEYELEFENETLIQLVDENYSDVLPHIEVNLTPFSELLKNENEIVDVMGIVKSVSDLKTILKSEKSFVKRDIHLVDNSYYEVKCTLWGKLAEDFYANSDSIMLIKGAKVSKFDRCTLSILNTTTIQIDPDIQSAHDLRTWHQMNGYLYEYTPISESSNEH